MAASSALLKENQTTIIVIGILIFGIAITVVTVDLSVDMPVTTLASLFIGGGAVIYYSFLISVKFYSYLIIAENYRTTTFHPKVEIAHDEEWNADIALVFGGGYNSPGRLLSYPDVETTTKRAIEVFAVMDPFMVETVGNDHFILIRGKPYTCNSWEKQAFLNRPGIREALGDSARDVKTLHFVFASTTLHPDVLPEETPSLDDLATLIGKWQQEIEGINVHSEERLDRMLRTADRARQRRPAPQVTVQAPPQEEKNEQR